MSDRWRISGDDIEWNQLDELEFLERLGEWATPSLSREPFGESFPARRIRLLEGYLLGVLARDRWFDRADPQALIDRCFELIADAKKALEAA